MEDTNTQEVVDVEASEETSESTEAPKRLERIEEGRWIAGVATGFAEYLHLPVWFVRVLLLLTLTAGGSGILIYVALAVLIPHEADDESLVQQWFGPKQSNPTKEA